MFRFALSGRSRHCHWEELCRKCPISRSGLRSLLLRVIFLSEDVAFDYLRARIRSSHACRFFDVSQGEMRFSPMRLHYVDDVCQATRLNLTTDLTNPSCLGDNWSYAHNSNGKMHRCTALFCRMSIEINVPLAAPQLLKVMSSATEFRARTIAILERSFCPKLSASLRHD
jgi:hypothetical protein